jgi:hypothetical protein
MEAAHLARIAINDLVTERDLPVAAERDTAVAADTDDRRTVKLALRGAHAEILSQRRTPRRTSYSAERLRARGWALS